MAPSYIHHNIDVSTKKSGNPSFDTYFYELVESHTILNVTLCSFRMTVAKVIYKYIICSYLYVTILFTKVPEYTPFKKIKIEIASGMVLTSTCSPHKAINTSALCFFLRKKKRTGALCCHDICNRQHQTQAIITRDKQHSTT